MLDFIFEERNLRKGSVRNEREGRGGERWGRKTKEGFKEGTRREGIGTVRGREGYESEDKSERYCMYKLAVKDG